MVDLSRKMDVETVISFSEDLVVCLKDRKDINNLTQCLEHDKALQSSCTADFNEVQFWLEDYRNKLAACKQKTEEAKSETAEDAEIDSLQKELENNLQWEQLLREEISSLVNEISDLEQQRVSIDEQKKNLKKLEKQELQAQRLLSMYASVTNIVPELDNPSVSGHIVEKMKEVVHKFEFDSTKLSAFDACNNLWDMIDK